MSFRPRIKLLAACVGAALAQLGAGQAFADSAVGVDTALGNALNPPGRSAIPRPLAGDGYDTVRHSPSGQLYGEPLAAQETSKTEGGWEYSGGIEAGVLGGGANTKSAKFREYKDLKNGGYLNYFEGEGDKTDTAHYIQAFGGGIGNHDQFFGVQFGYYNEWKLKAFYNETPHVFSDNFKALYSSNGSNRLQLNFNPATQLGGVYATTAANALVADTAIGNYTKSLPDTEIGLVRKKGGLRFDANLSVDWKVFASLTQEDRKGSRPFSFILPQANGGANDMAVEGVEPISYKTTDLIAGLQYSDRLTAVNLRASASIFKNDIHNLYVQDPNLNPALANGTLANTNMLVYSLPPDNQAYNVKGELSRKLPDFYKGQLTAGFAWGTNRQNDTLRTPLDPSLVTSGTGTAATNGIAFNASNWNGVNGSPLTRGSAGQRVDTQLLNLGLTLNPTDDLTLKGTVRSFKSDNKSGTYYSYNPLTGQWFAGLDAGTPSAFALASFAPLGQVAGCQPAPGFPVINCGATASSASPFTGSQRSFFSPPRSNKQTNYAFSADYDLGQSRSVEGAIEREDFSHTYRERDKTWEDKLKLTYVDRNLGDATLRASYEHDRKRGSFYDPLVSTRTGQDWFAIYGYTYSRSQVQGLLNQAIAGAVGFPTLANIQTWVLANNGGAGNSGGWMKPDQADRDQNILNARLNYMVRDDMDIGAMVQVKSAKYPSNGNLGPQKEDLNSYNFELNYQPISGFQFSAYYSRQDGKQRQTDNFTPAAAVTTYAQTACTGGAALSAATATLATIECFLNNARDPRYNAVVDTKNTNDIFGLSAMHDVGSMKLSANYTYAKGKTSIVHAYGSLALSQVGAQAAQTTYGDFPDQKTVMQTLELNLLVPIDKKLSARLMYRYENFRVNDWHYDYYSSTPGNGYFIPADYGPQNYHVNVIGAFAQYKF